MKVTRLVFDLIIFVLKMNLTGYIDITSQYHKEVFYIMSLLLYCRMYGNLFFYFFFYLFSVLKKSPISSQMSLYVLLPWLKISVQLMKLQKLQVSF